MDNKIKVLSRMINKSINQKNNWEEDNIVITENENSIYLGFVNPTDLTVFYEDTGINSVGIKRFCKKSLKNKINDVLSKNPIDQEEPVAYVMNIITLIAE